ncbi:hypothetical protein [Marinobacter salarius]|uniref:hypothetical protein n=1 Tax=Marinobacter salarius TaxID=1420917 RepID=UPI00241DE600|nr:hypothetical protein [Marinobacter salarius]
MASILGKLAIQEGDSYTAVAGSNRAVVVAGTGESAFSSREIVGITFGGVAMTRAAYTGDTETAKGGVYYILESQIPAGSSVIAVDWDGQVHDAFTGAVYTLGGIDQATPVNNFNSAVGVSLFDLDITFNGVDGGVLVAGAGSNSPADTLNQSSTISATTTTVTVDHAQTTAGHEGSAISGVLSAAGSETLGLRYSSETDPVGALAVFNPAASGPSVSAADDITSEGDTAEFTLANNSAAPVSATLNGTDVGTLTLVSGSTYSYTAPLIADDDTADLVVTVDSTTASTVIGYANSYPYELVTHGEPDANSAFFDTAFATNGPVEWGVVTDFDSGVVVVDWATMDAAEDELNDIALHSTEVAAGDSTATLKYFVPESGATGTFQATATVDGTDDTAPTISSASVPTAGNNIAVQMSESMQVGAGGSGGWTISLAGVSVSSASVDGSDDTIINLTPSRTLTDEDTLAIGYTQPGDGFQDQAATPNDLATLSGQAVTNNSTQQPPDVTGPVTQSVGVPTAGTYAIGDDLSFTVNWDEAVTVTGTPALNLDIGGTSRQADYVSGSGSSALVFTYTVQAGDEDDNGIAVSSLTLEDGTLQDASSNNATLTLNSVGDTSGVLVDGLAPVISINSLTTTDTTPVVTGSSGDATSLTLVVNSVTYNPTPSGGTWSQQLPELALDTYPMTLNGQDAAGNDAVEAQAVLTVVDEIVATGNGLFRPLFRANKKSTFKNLFR